jgi:hypothetical protein
MQRQALLMIIHALLATFAQITQTQQRTILLKVVSMLQLVLQPKVHAQQILSALEIKALKQHVLMVTIQTAPLRRTMSLVAFHMRLDNLKEVLVETVISAQKELNLLTNLDALRVPTTLQEVNLLLSVLQTHVLLDHGVMLAQLAVPIAALMVAFVQVGLTN